MLCRPLPQLALYEAALTAYVQHRHCIPGLFCLAFPSLIVLRVYCNLYTIHLHICYSLHSAVIVDVYATLQA